MFAFANPIGESRGRLGEWGYSVSPLRFGINARDQSEQKQEKELRNIARDPSTGIASWAPKRDSYGRFPLCASSPARVPVFG